METQQDYPAAKKLWQRKTGRLHLLHSQATEVEHSSSLFLPRLFCSRIVLLCFHPILVSVLSTGPSLLVLNFYGKFFTRSLCSFLAAWQ